MIGTEWFYIYDFANELEVKIDNNKGAYNISEDCLKFIRTSQKIIKTAADLAQIIDLRYSEDIGDKRCMGKIGEILGGVSGRTINRK